MVLCVVFGIEFVCLYLRRLDDIMDFIYVLCFVLCSGVLYVIHSVVCSVLYCHVVCSAECGV